MLRGKKIFTAALGITMLSTAGTAHAMLLGDATNGKAVHDAKCMGCHAAQFNDPTKVYTRNNRTVKTVEGLMKRVEFCSKQIGANLSEKELDDIIKYLNDSFYKFE